MILILFLTATAIASTFCTPLLLSNLGPSPRLRRGDSKRIPGCLASGTRDRLRWSEPDFSTLPPTILPTFAQYTDLSIRDTQHGVDDTGAIVRALLPINNTKIRENLQFYHGMATLVNSRVICVRPTVLDARLGWDNRSKSTFLHGNLSLGAICPSGIHHDSVRDPNYRMDFKTPIPFHCYLVEPDAIGIDWPISLCAVGSATGHPSSPGRFGLQVDSPFDGAGQPRPYVITNYTGSVPTIFIETQFSFSTTETSSLPWIRLKWEGVEDFELLMSLCFPSFQAAERPISAERPIPSSSSTAMLSEPLLPINPSVAFNSAALLRQLGTYGHSSSSSSENDRGIMKLEPLQMRVCGCSSNLDFTFGFSNRAFGQLNWNNEPINYFPHTYGLCTGCGREMKLEEAVANGGVREGVGGAKRINGVLAGIFMDALKSEGVGLAKALQSLFWVLNAQHYYRRLPYFNETGYSSRTSLFELHIFPRERYGLWVVCGVIGVHVLVVLLAVFVLLRRLGLKRDSGWGTFMDALKSREVRLAMVLQALFWVLKMRPYYRWMQQQEEN